jgi:hypothetical protein
MDINYLHSVSESDFVNACVRESQSFIDTFAGKEDSPAMLGYAEYGIPWYQPVCQDQEGLQDVVAYHAQVEDVHCSAWMDNTTIMVACNLMSENGAEAMTPLTVWDLVTFIRAVVCYEHIYHHEHPYIDDVHINKLLGGDVLKKVPVPFRAIDGDRFLPATWNGSHRFMCDTWADSFAWLQRLHDSVGSRSLDGQQIEEVTHAWRKALGKDDIQPKELVDFVGVNTRWTSPSNQLLKEMVDVTSLEDLQTYLDLNEKLPQIFISEGINNILSDLNLRSHVNQSIARFFALPYACSAARLPFLKYLYNRGLKVQQELYAAKLIDKRYEQLSQGVQLRLPVFLAIALREANNPPDLWIAIAKLRAEASKFRIHRAAMDRALIRGDLKEKKEVEAALNVSVDSLLEIAGSITSPAIAKLAEPLSKGDLPTMKDDISAVFAAGKGVLETSFVERLMWRLRKPQLLWINDLLDQSAHLTEALPDFSRVWQIPPNRQAVFVERFKHMAGLTD